MIASGPTADVLTPSLIRQLYGVEATSPRIRARAGWSWFRSGRDHGAVSQAIRRRLIVTTWRSRIPALAVIVGAPIVGSTSIDLWRALDRSVPISENVDAQIFFIARLPRTLAGALVGATLATAGVVFQGLLRNPLATPFTLGISSGAALGAMLAITFDWTIRIRRRVRRADRELRGVDRRGRHRVRAFVPRDSAGLSTERSAPRRRHAERVLLGARSCSSSTSPTSPRPSGRCAG